LADEGAMLVYRVTAWFPKEELFGLTSQIRRTAVSVPSNIVDGGLIRALRDIFQPSA
jgi:four helix bundle protein